MSHTDGIVDNSLNLWINTHQAQLNAQPVAFVPLATNDIDTNNIAVIEDDGTCLIPVGASNSLDHIAIVEKFYQTHNDLYDFLLIFSAVPITNGSIFKLVHNVTTGTTVDIEDNRGVLARHLVLGAPFDAATGPIRNLKAITQYADLTTLPANPNTLIPLNNDTPLSLIAQEIGHYWGMAAPFATCRRGGVARDRGGGGPARFAARPGRGRCRRPDPPRHQARQYPARRGGARAARGPGPGPVDRDRPHAFHRAGHGAGFAGLPLARTGAGRPRAQHPGGSLFGRRRRPRDAHGPASVRRQEFHRDAVDARRGAGPPAPGLGVARPAHADLRTDGESPGGPARDAGAGAHASRGS